MSLAIAELVDVSTFQRNEDGTSEIGLTGARITGARVPLEWVARSWLTPRGVLQNRARGVDIREMENATFGLGDLDRWRAAMVAEAEAVEYVCRCAVAVELVAREVLITAAVTLVDGKTYQLAVRLADASALVDFGGAQ